MELPDHYFPVSPCPYFLKDKYMNKTLLNFAEFGAYQNVNLCHGGENSVIKFWPQKSQQSTTGLSAALPTIPLSEEPTENQWISTDRILGFSSFKDTVWKMKSVTNTLTLLGSSLHQNPTTSKKLKQCKEALQDQEKSKGKSDITSVLHQKLPSSVHDLYKKLDDIGHAYNSNCLSGFNRDFYGGLLAYASLECYATDMLIHSKGSIFNEICVSLVSTNFKTGLKVVSPKCSFPSSTVYQICTSNKTGEKVLVCARGKENCQLFSLCCDSENLKEEKSTEFGESISSVCFNPFLENEVLVSSPNGNVFLWDIESSASNLRLTKRKEAGVRNPWSTSYFGGHPRHIFVANNTSVLMVDHRTKFQDGVTLFSLPAHFAQKHEQIMAACSAGFPYHCAATDHGLFLLDCRFPGTPVLNWSSEMLSPPQYMQLLESQVETRCGRKLLFLASQQPAEVMCFPLDIVSARPPTAPVYPWRVSRINDFGSISKTAGTEVRQRFEYSLAGFTTSVPSHNGSFTVYQLDSCGDIFYQSFVSDKNAVPQSHRENSASSSKVIGSFQSFKACTDHEKAEANKRAENWFAALERQFTAFKSVSRQEKDYESSKIAPELVLEIFNCAPSQDESLKFKEAGHTNSKEVNPHKPHRNLVAFPNLLYKKCETQLLLALRDGRDITGLLKIREARQSKLKLLKRREASRQERENNPWKQKRKAQYQARKRRKVENSRGRGGGHSDSGCNIEDTEQNDTNGNSMDKGWPSNDTVETNNMEENISGDKIVYDNVHVSDESSSTSVEMKPEQPQNKLIEDDMQVSPRTPSKSALPPELPLSSLNPPERVATPSLFSSSSSSSSPPSSPSSSSSSSSSSDEESAAKNSGAVEMNLCAEDQRETLPYNNVISWLLHSYSSNVQSPGGQETETIKSSPKKASTSYQLSSTAETPGLSHADIKREIKVERCYDNDVDDTASVCSSQRSNTRSRLELRRVVDPYLSGFLSTPERAKKMKRNFPE